MPLFIVQHQHPAERCPTRQPSMAQMLLKHLSDENAAKFGLRIKAHAVADGAHRLVMIVEARDAKAVEKFVEPFKMAGNVEISPSSSCEVVVQRGFC